MSLSLFGLRYTVGTITWALLTMPRNCFIEAESLCFMNQEGKDTAVCCSGRETNYKACSVQNTGTVDNDLPVQSHPASGASRGMRENCSFNM